LDSICNGARTLSSSLIRGSLRLPGTSGWGLDTQAFSASGTDVDGLEFAALDALPDG
jgi:hypothetical protein